MFVRGDRRQGHCVRCCVIMRAMRVSYFTESKQCKLFKSPEMMQELYDITAFVSRSASSWNIDTVLECCEEFDSENSLEVCSMGAV